VKVGFNLASINPIATPDFLVAAATRAEANGFSSLWVGEHVVLFDEYDSTYPYDESGKLFLSGEVGMLEPFQMLAFCAAATERIRLGTGVCLLPQRNPVYTAKDVATLDWLSAGRLDFGIGLGWSREEFGALDVPGSAAPRGAASTSRSCAASGSTPSRSTTASSTTCLRAGSTRSRCSNPTLRSTSAVRATRHCAGSRSTATGGTASG